VDCGCVTGADYGAQGGGVNGYGSGREAPETDRQNLQQRISERHELTEAAGLRHRCPYRRCAVSGPERNAEESRESLSFEQIIDQLSSVVTQLEDGELPLEQALARFEHGVALSRLGSKRLDEAERRIEVLLRDAQGVDTRSIAEEFKADE
jgi:exodeoxyribonuclease VII small subunit